jgi:hypothetical protein
MRVQLKVPMRAVALLCCAAFCLAAALTQAQTPTAAQTAPTPGNTAAPVPDDTITPVPGNPIAIVPGNPIAIVPIDTKPDQTATVTGALEVTGGKAIIAASGSITSGTRTTDVILPRRGTLRVCASTTVKLAADTSVPAGEMPGLLMAMDHGAVEMSFANTSGNSRNADVLLTPDFRILIGGPGASEVKVRLGREGDTCVDNSGADAPYVLVTSLFSGGLYRVQPGQRVMFQHGNLGEVVDEEREPCGCPSPPAAETHGNEFPLAQSEGLAPTPAPKPAVEHAAASPPAAPLVYNSAEHAPKTAAIEPPAATAAPAKPATKKKKPGFFAKMGQFFRRIFGAEP